MNHSESNLNKLFNQCYILVPDLGNLLSKELVWPLPLLFRWPGLSRWLFLMVSTPASHFSGGSYAGSLGCCSYHQHGPGPQLTEALQHCLCRCLRHTAEGHLRLLAFCGMVMLTRHGSACDQTLQTEHDPCAQPHGPEHRKGNTGEEHWREDPAVKINADTFHKQRWPFVVSGQG